MARVAFIGLGNMGGPMASNLAGAGHAVTAFDLVPAALEVARAAGATIAESTQCKSRATRSTLSAPHPTSTSPMPRTEKPTTRNPSFVSAASRDAASWPPKPADVMITGDDGVASLGASSK